MLGIETECIDASRCFARTLLLVPLLLLGSSLTAERAIAAEAPAQAEVGFADHIGQERAARGIGGLAPASDLQAVARRHAQRMAERGQPYHNPNLGSEVQGWEVVSENVGAGANVAQIHDAFMASPTHRNIILSGELTELGVGVVAANGELWVVQVFRRPSQAAAAPAQPAPAPAPPRAQPAPAAPAPRPAAPPTTVAPPPVATTVPAPPPPPPPPTTVPVDDLTGRSSGSVTFGTGAASPHAAPAPEAADDGVPPLAWVAAVMLLGVVAFQVRSLRSSTLPV